MSTPNGPAGEPNPPIWNPNAGAVPPAPQQYPPQPPAVPPRPAYPAQPQQPVQPQQQPVQPVQPQQQPAYPAPQQPQQPQQPAYPAQPQPPYQGQPAYPAQPQQPYQGQQPYPTQQPQVPGYGQPPAPAFTAPHVNQPMGAGASALQAPLPSRSGTPGKVALLLAVLAGIVAPLIAIGTSVPLGLALKDFVAANGWPESLHWLHPVATWELVTELTLYTGMLLGVLAIVFAIIAISQQRGKRQGKIALILIGVGIVLTLGGLAATLLLPQAIG